METDLSADRASLANGKDCANLESWLYEVDGAKSNSQKLLVALFHDGMRSAALEFRLTAMGHHAKVFTNVGEYLLMLRSGQRFDLLLITGQGDLPDKLPLLGAQLLEIPALFFLDQGSWSGLPSWSKSFLWCDAVDFGIARTTNEELHWRMHALLLRKKAGLCASPKASESGQLIWGNYQFLESRNMVLHSKRVVYLQPRQFEFALQLFRSLNRVLTREWLRESLWNIGSHRDGSRALDVHAANLRTKLELCEENGFVLCAVYGKGYCLNQVKPDFAGKS